MPATTVTRSVTINATPETAWRFLSEPDKLLAWMTFIPGQPAPEGSVFEPRTGGRIRIVFPNGAAAVGEVLELDPPRRLAFTWGYDPDAGRTGIAPGASRVELILEPTNAGTRATLTHSGLPNADAARRYDGGWRHYLTQLAHHASTAHHAAHLGATLDAYFAACNEPDPARRAERLAASCEPDVRVRSPFACSDTIEEFSVNIEAGLRFLNGAVSAPDGPARHVHGFARVPWSVTAPDGSLLFRGENLLRLTPAGRIAEIISFHED